LLFNIGFKDQKNMRDIYYKLLTVVLLIGISSCGYQLRGTQPDYLSNISSIYIIDSNASPVTNEIRTQLSLSGISITSATGDPEYTLEISSQSIVQSVLSVSAITGKVEEYQILLRVRMSVRDKEKNDLLSNQLISLTRDYAFDDQAVLGSAAERQLLTNEMIKQAALQIVRRLNTITR
jgi:LPS-assembly lipoprotein